MKCIGALIGDLVGSKYEFHNIKVKNFQFTPEQYRLTDDSYMTFAVMDYFVEKSNPISFYFRKWGNMFPYAGYGGRFHMWLLDEKMGPYGSFGNGSAMRISPVGWIAKSEDEVINFSRVISECTHNHPLGIEGAEVIAMCIYYAKIGKSKEFIGKYAGKHYNFDFSYDSLVKNYYFDETCQGSVPQAIFCFLISNDFEDCLRTAISIGGDSDTIAAMACSIAEAFYGKIPENILQLLMDKLTPSEVKLLEDFNKQLEV